MPDIGFFCAGAAQAALRDPIARFEERRGVRILLDFGPVGRMKQRILAGEAVQVVVLSRPAIADLAAQGRVVASTVSDIGTTGVGIAVRKGAARPDVSTADGLRRTLLAAASLSYGDPAHGDSSGIHFASVIERLAIREALAGKTILAASGVDVVDRVARGEAELGATQSSVIRANAGVELAGMLPGDLQHCTTYAIALVAGLEGAVGEWASGLLAHLTSAEARQHYERFGLAQASASRPRG